MKNEVYALDFLQMIFLNGSLSSVQAVLLVLREFDTLPGLSISPSKSSFYSSGLSQEEKDRISFSVGLYHGIFHVRYLGVPLCTKKLTLANWESLLHIIKVKINCWSVKSLSIYHWKVPAFGYCNCVSLEFLDLNVCLGKEMYWKNKIDVLKFLMERHSWR